MFVCSTFIHLLCHCFMYFGFVRKNDFECFEAHQLTRWVECDGGCRMAIIEGKAGEKDIDGLMLSQFVSRAGISLLCVKGRLRTLVFMFQNLVN